ncbi:hypothetical protein CANCADRAFT_11370, partial [Tortispora caseinolytica NRRL Y-17796]
SSFINSRHFYQNTVIVSYANREQHPVSLRQLSFFGRRLTKDRIIASANFVQTELPTRLAHRIYNIQQLPFYIMCNPRLSFVYELYYKAFDKFRRFKKIQTLEDNEEFCHLVASLLDDHQRIIPNLIIGSIEACHENAASDASRIDDFINIMLRSRISRRVIAEQHLTLTANYASKTDGHHDLPDYLNKVIGNVKASEVIRRCADLTSDIIKQFYPDQQMPEIIIDGHLDTVFPYTVSHFRYIICELLRNAIQATLTQPTVNPIKVSVYNTSETVIIRVSDQGGGIPASSMSSIWSFVKDGNREDLVARLQSLRKIPRLSARAEEVILSSNDSPAYPSTISPEWTQSSLSQFTTRSPEIRLGIGLPMSRVYAEYWGGSLDLTSIEGYGTDVVLQISNIGNKSERLQLDAV